MGDYGKGVTSIDEKFLGTGDLFALKYNSGLVFVEVDGWEQTEYRPYSQIGSVGAETGSGFTRLDDGNSDDVLFVEKDETKVIHAGIGHSPADIRRYTNYPESTNRLRRIPNLSVPTPGNDYGYVDGEDSPYSDPTDAEELFIPPNQHLNFNFFNSDKEPHEVLLNIKMRVYDVHPLDPRDSRNEDAVRRVMSPGSPIPIASVGSLDNQADYGLAKAWGVDTIPVSRAREI